MMMDARALAARTAWKHFSHTHAHSPGSLSPPAATGRSPPPPMRSFSAPVLSTVVPRGSPEKSLKHLRANSASEAGPRASMLVDFDDDDDEEEEVEGEDEEGAAEVEQEEGEGEGEGEAVEEGEGNDDKEREDGAGEGEAEADQGEEEQGRRGGGEGQGRAEGAQSAKEEEAGHVPMHGQGDDREASVGRGDAKSEKGGASKSPGGMPPLLLAPLPVATPHAAPLAPTTKQAAPELRPALKTAGDPALQPQDKQEKADAQLRYPVPPSPLHHAASPGFHGKTGATPKQVPRAGSGRGKSGLGRPRHRKTQSDVRSSPMVGAANHGNKLESPRRGERREDGEGGSKGEEDDDDEADQLTPQLLLGHVSAMLARSVEGMAGGSGFVQLCDSPQLMRSLAVLDRTPAAFTHKVGMMYMANAQQSIEEILQNKGGSVRYSALLKGLGSLVRVKNCQFRYTGGVDRLHDTDGTHALMYTAAMTHVVFHVATHMPMGGAGSRSKKRLLANDYVTVVFCDQSTRSDDDLPPPMLSDFNFVTLVVKPLGTGYSQVRSVCKHPPHELDVGPFASPRVVSDSSLPFLLRTAATIADSRSVIRREGTASVTNLQDRLRQIKQIASRYACPNP